MTVPITGSVKDVTGVEDNDTPWSFASVIRFADDGSVITEKPREVRAVSGNLKVNLVPGYAIVTYGKQVWQVTVPETATTLKALIEAGVAFPPDTPQALLDAAVGQYVETHREQFRTRAVPVVGDPTMAQWVDEYDNPVGDPVPWSQVVSETIAQAAVEAEAPAAVDADLASRSIGFVDEGSGEGYFTVGGVPVSGTLVPPAAAWPTTVGVPSKLAAGVAKDGTTDDRAALASSDTSAVSASLPLMLLPGTYRVSSNLTVSSPVWCTPGAVLKPDSGITVTLAGGIVSNSASKIFDHSSGGKVVVKRAREVSPHWWGAVGDGVADDTAAIQAAIDSQRIAVNTTPCLVSLSAGTYKLTATIDARCTVSGATQWDDFKGIVGAGRNATTLVMHTNNVPIFRFSGRYFSVRGFTAKFNTMQTTANTAGNVFDFEDMVYFTSFDDLLLENGYIGINSKNGEKTDVGSCLFSNTFSNIRFINNRYMHWRFSATGGESAGGTGNHVSNIYMSSPTVDRMYRAVERFGGYEDVWNQLNIEHTNIEDCAFFDTGGDSFTISGFHLEGVRFFCGSGNRSVVATNGRGRAKVDLNIDHCFFGPHKISGITRSSTTATATVDLYPDATVGSHGLRVGDTVVVDGANETEYNGTFTVTAVPSSTTFEYTVSGSPATPATLASGVDHMVASLGAAVSTFDFQIVRANVMAETIELDLRIRDVRTTGKNHAERNEVLRIASGQEPGARIKLRSLSTRGQLRNAHLSSPASIVALSRTSNVATVYTRTPHRLSVGDSVYINSAAGSYLGAATVASVVGPHRFTYANTGTDAALARTTSDVMFLKTYGTTNRSRSGNIATLTLGAHSLLPGMRIRVAGVSGYTAGGGSAAILSTTATTISYLSAGADESTTANTGGSVMLLDAGVSFELLTETSTSPVLVEADWLYSGCEALDFGTVNAGAAATQTTTHYGVRSGDRIDWNPSAAIPDGLQIQAVASGTNTITWRVFNPTAGNIVSGVNIVRYRFGR